MTKQQKEQFDNLYNFSGSFFEEEKNEKQEKQKAKERVKRVKQRKKQEERNKQFDIETEKVINMTNKNYKNKEQRIIKNKSKKQAKIMRKKKRIKKILKFTMLLIIIIAGIVFCLVSPIFNVREIKVKNNNQIDSNTIISLSQINIGQNIFKYRSQKVKNEIKTNAYIESVTIERKIPNTIEITIEEREKNYNVEFLNGYAYINNQGYILEVSETKLELPTIIGISTNQEEIVPGNRLNKEDLEKLEVVIQIMNICKNYDLNSKITNIDIENKENYTLYIEQEMKTVYLGDETNLSNKILYLPTVLEENKEKEGYIYINGDLNNNFKPRFREKV